MRSDPGPLLHSNRQSHLLRRLSATRTGFFSTKWLTKKIVLRTKCVAIQIEFVLIMNIELMYYQDMDEHKEKPRTLKLMEP